MERRERGFTLVEVVIGVAIIATTAAAGIAISLASRPAAVSAAAARFDALLDAARTEARAFDSGVTIAFTAPNANPAIDGFQARLYRNRPSTGTLVALNFAGIDAAVSLREREILGTPGFALTVHHDGRVSGITGYTPVGQSSLPEVNCPASGSYHFVFSAAGGQADRYVPCRITLAASGPIAYASIPPGGTSSPPPANGCGNGPCSNAPPVQMSTCPPNSFLNGTGCIDSPLLVTPSSLLFLHPGDPMQGVNVSESSYSGPISISSNSCGGSGVTVSGYGNGPNTSFSVSSSRSGVCSFVIADDHGGAQAISVRTYGLLSVTPTNWDFPSASTSGQAVLAHEDAYSGSISVEGSSTGPHGEAGCDGFANYIPQRQNTDGSFDAEFTIAPTASKPTCVLTLHDDHSGAVQVFIRVEDPRQLVCDTDPRAGQTIGGVQFVGTGKAPPCVQTMHCSPNNEPKGAAINVGGTAYIADGNPCRHGQLTLESPSCSPHDYENPGWASMGTNSDDTSIFSNSLVPLSAGTAHVTVSGSWEVFANLQTCHGTTTPKTVNYTITVYPDLSWEGA